MDDPARGELVDDLPMGLLPQDVSADVGVAELDGRTVRWNDDLPVGG